MLEIFSIILALIFISKLIEDRTTIPFVLIIIISIIMAVGFTYFFIDIQNFSIYHLLILFTPLMAIDVVSVGAIFSKFKLPNRLKLYAEIAIYLMASISFLIADKLELSAILAVVISIANVINIEILLKYKMEILYVFVLTALICYLVIVAFTIYKKHPFRRGNILMLLVNGIKSNKKIDIEL